MLVPDIRKGLNEFYRRFIGFGTKPNSRFPGAGPPLPKMRPSCGRIPPLIWSDCSNPSTLMRIRLTSRKLQTMRAPRLARQSAPLESARKGETVFSLMRPPGHHAERGRAMGFCYLNNIAVAALQALATGAKRVAVYDFDVHHGNGTEQILINQPGVAFFSIHQYPCYPGTGSRNVGNNCFNYPVPPQTPRREYRVILKGALDQLKNFKPDLVAVSAGFDAYARDPLAQETLEAEDFHWLGESFRKLNLPVFSLLEGGYSDDLPDLILAYLKGLQNH